MVWCLLSLDREASTFACLSGAACSALSFCLRLRMMTQSPLDEALDRAERALLRIERSVERGATNRGRDEHLRGKVPDALADLDQFIREAGR